MFYSLLGVTAVAGVALAVTGGITLAWHSDYASHEVLGAEREELKQSGRALAHSTDALIGVTAAGALATLIVSFFTRFTGEPARGRIRLTPSAAAGGLQLHLVGRY